MPDQKLILCTSWFLTLVSIPLLSIFGRPLQKWAFSELGVQHIAVLLGITMLLLFLALISYLVKTGKAKRYWLPLLFLLAVTFPLIHWKIPVVEERIHVILFGLFGFLSIRLFPFLIGILLCIAVSASDELLQFYLADRVGEWPDVFLNLASSTLGVTLAVFLRLTEKDNPACRYQAEKSHE